MGIEELEKLLNEKYSKGEISLEQFNQMLENLKISDPISRIQYLVELKTQGNNLAKEGKYEESLAKYNKALEIEPEYSDVWNNKAIVLKRLGRAEEAKIWLYKYNTLLKSKKKKKSIVIAAACVVILAIIIGGIILIPPLIHVPLYKSGDVVNNSSMGPNSAFVVVEKKNNQYSTVLATPIVGGWVWKPIEAFTVNAYDFDRKYDNKIMSFYQNKYVEGDLVKNNTMRSNDVILVVYSGYGAYDLLHITQTNKLDNSYFSDGNKYESYGRSFDPNYTIFVGHTDLNNVNLIQTPIPKYVAGDILLDKEDQSKLLWTTIIRYIPENDEYEIDYIWKNDDGSWGYFLDTKTSFYDRSFIERQFPYKLDHVDLSKIRIGNPLYSNSVNQNSPSYQKTNFQIGDIAKPTMYSNEGYLIKDIDYTSNKYGVVRVTFAGNWQPSAGQPTEWYDFSSFEITYHSKK
jgi:tetratricopeptide (TPR) repeat protein